MLRSGARFATGCLVILFGGIALLAYISHRPSSAQWSAVAPPAHGDAEEDAGRSDKAHLPGRTPDQVTYETAKRTGLGWTYRSYLDQMGPGTVKIAEVLSMNEVEFDFPYKRPQRARLMLRAHPRQGKDVMLSIERGQFVCESDECRLLVRFGDSAAVTFEGSQPADGTTRTLFLHPYARFLSRTRKADRVYVEAQFYQQGTRIFEFDVTGLQWEEDVHKASSQPAQLDREKETTDHFLDRIAK